MKKKPNTHSSFYISAAHKSSGKTTLSIGLCHAYRTSGRTVAPFKKGPDYIDPIWLGRAAGRACYNLDFNVQEDAEISGTFARNNADVRLVEGNKGLFDGMRIDGGDSNAALANLLAIPVILVVDTVGITRGVVPLLSGYQNFRFPKANIAGVILNKVGGARHESKLVSAIREYTDIKVFGSIFNSDELLIKERHQGLVPGNEFNNTDRMIERLGNVVKQAVDIEQILNASKTSLPRVKSAEPPDDKYDLTIAIARDEAFGFYYQSDLDEFDRLGVSCKFFSIIHDHKPPAADGIFIGGGFPETHARSISTNQSMLADIKDKIEHGMPVYAECGGLMILANKLIWKNKSYPMAGVIKADCLMGGKPQGRGYIKIVPDDKNLWHMPRQTINAHEFHYSKLINMRQNYPFAYKVLRGEGISGGGDGIMVNNLLASYAHLRSSRSNNWVRYFVKFIAAQKNM